MGDPTEIPETQREKELCQAYVCAKINNRAALREAISGNFTPLVQTQLSDEADKIAKRPYPYVHDPFAGRDRLSRLTIGDRLALREAISGNYSPSAHARLLDEADKTVNRLYPYAHDPFVGRDKVSGLTIGDRLALREAISGNYALSVYAKLSDEADESVKRLYPYAHDFFAGRDRLSRFVIGDFESQHVHEPFLEEAAGLSGSMKTPSSSQGAPDMKAVTKPQTPVKYGPQTEWTNPDLERRFQHKLMRIIVIWLGYEFLLFVFLCFVFLALACSKRPDSPAWLF